MMRFKSKMKKGKKKALKKKEALQEKAVLIVVKIVVENCNCGRLW